METDPAAPVKLADVGSRDQLYNTVHIDNNTVLYT